MNFQNVKEAYVELYGKFYNEAEFDNFDEAFRAAWDSFDFVPGAETANEVAEAICECSQMQQFSPVE